MTNGFIVITNVEDLVDLLCRIIPRQSEEIEDADMKFQASMVLSDPRKQILVPTQEEWLGFNLLDRDGELIRKKNR